MTAERGLFRRLSRWTRAALLIERGGASAFERLQEARADRRRFLRQVAGLALVAGATRIGGGCGGGGCGERGARVVVLGGGLAGLTSCHLLAKAGMRAEVYEASERVGGRVMSARISALRAPVELGGEFIDTEHKALMALVAELGLTLFDTAPDDAPSLDSVYFVGGRRLSEADLLTELVPLARAMIAARATLADDGQEIAYDSPSNAEALDRQSVADFVLAAGTGPGARAVLEAAYLNEYGIALGEQSALNLIMMFSPEQLASTAAGRDWDVYGDSDERYTVAEGNQRVAERLAERYRDRIHHGAVLEALADRADGRIAVTFEGGEEIIADKVICTVPFSILRRLDLTRLSLSPVKRRAIAELGYGMNTKLCVPLSGRPWLARGEDGTVFSDARFQSIWDPHARREDPLGVLTNFLGGRAAVDADRLAVPAHAAELMGMLEGPWPGIAALAREGAVRQQWPKHPWVRASYSGYLVGQWTSIGGAESEPHGNLHFAGEHTSWDWQGYMCGAVDSAHRAVAEVLGEKTGRARAARRGVVTA